MEDEARRQLPQHADEGHQQDQRLQQADAEIRGQIGEVRGILLHALVGVDTNGAGIGQAESARRPHPLVDQIERQRLAKFQPDHLVEPGLTYVEHQQPAGNDCKDEKLVQEGCHVSARERIVERLVPAVEQNLADRGCDNDGHHAD